MDYEQNNQDYGYTWEPQQPQPYPPKEKKKEKKGIGTGAAVALMLVCALLGGILGASGVLLGSKLIHELPLGSDQNGSVMLQGNRENTVIDIHQIDTSKVMTPAEVYAQNVNSTVGITTSITTNYWGYQTTSAASGSGFVLTKDGYILTNFHVVEDSSSITVALYDGTTYDAALIGYDKSNDIAVLKVEATDLVPVVLGDSDNMNVGDDVVAIGNPLGELTFSLTSGAVSAIDRQVTMSSGATMNLIQTDCAINSGNSGGALFNMYGEVIGITNAKYSSNSSSGASIDNIGFAIPIKHVQSMVESIIEKGYVSKPYIGLSVANVSEETQIYGLPQGAAVRKIEAGSPAENSGLQLNDIITHADGTQITGSSDLVSYVSKKQIGDSIKLTVYRQGSTLEITLTVGEQIQSAQQNDQQQTQQDQQGGFPWSFGFGN